MFNTGECATEAEIGDLLSLVAALDYEVEQWSTALDLAMGGVGGGGCDPGTDPECPHIESIIEELIATCENGSDYLALDGGSCGAEVISAGVSLAGWVSAKVGIFSLGAKASAAAVAAAASGAVIAAVGVGLGVGMAIACLT